LPIGLWATDTGVTSEGEPGALHLERRDPRGNGPLSRRLDALVDVMKNLVKAQAFRALVALTMLASSALILEAGQRWPK
jgi:hypothetical protein